MDKAYRNYLLVLGMVIISILVIPATLGVRVSNAQDLNMDEIFRCVAEEEEDLEICAEARTLILNNCTACHTFVPIVMQQFDENGWAGLMHRHQDRMSHLSDDQITIIQTYLTQNFNPELDPPELPAELLRNWTDY
jgi:hypothetical protein